MAAAAILQSVQYDQEGRAASLCQILPKSLKLLLRYDDFSIFQDGGRRHLGFSKFRIFTGLSGQEGRTASTCQNRCNCSRDMAIITRAAILMRFISHHRVSVCVSVCHTLILYQNG